jgi:ElaB/YqjD/DUF883 family membrane-anchored ribosome-binding protein
MTSHDIDGDLGAVKDDLAKLRADIVQLSTALKEITSQTVHERLSTLQGEFGRMTDDAKARGRKQMDELAGQIEEQPLTSVLIAFGVGLLVGRLFDR